MAKTRKQRRDEADPITTLPPNSSDAAAAAPPPTAVVNHRSSKSKAAKVSAFYTQADLDSMINFLVLRQSETGDNGTFPKNVFTDCAAHLNQSIEVGGPKTPSSVGEKYKKFYRKEYNIIQQIIAKSGWPAWTDNGGANMPIDKPGQPRHNLSLSWDEFVKLNPEAAPYRNAGWPYLEQMRQIMPTATATGRYVYRVARTSQQPANIFSSLPNPDGEAEENLQDPSKRTSTHVNPPTDASASPQTTPDESLDTAKAPDSDIFMLQPISPPQASFKTSLQGLGLKNGNLSISTADRKPSSTKRKVPDTPFTPQADSKRHTQASANSNRTLTGPQAIADMTGSINRWNDTAIRLFQPQQAYPSSPERISNAIIKYQELEDDLTDAQLTCLIKIFESDASKANSYISLSRDSVRRTWVHQLISNEQERTSTEGLPL